MKLSVRGDTTDYRGDHAADVCRCVDLLEGETVEALAERVFRQRDSYHKPHLDVIRIQLVEEAP